MHRDGLIPAHAGKTVSVIEMISPMGAHPRSRGENSRRVSCRLRLWGSSPLTRGKHTTLTGWVTSVGLIPAHAGKTRESHEPFDELRAHPRSRGENPWSTPSSRKTPGSSPLTRGKPMEYTELKENTGLIPAHAGKTRGRSSQRQSTRAHPRSRGENHFEYSNPETIKGSSPLTRGKPSTLRSPARTAAAHPRSRGENRMRARSAFSSAGSSPLTRGKPDTGEEDCDEAGLIPAHAGKTPGYPRRPERPWAHPRSRGENTRATTASRFWPGSSPLTRGKLRAGRGKTKAVGLIPAHAGKTSCSTTSARTSRAHPRSRGENRSRRERSPATTGSSPLTRGKPATYQVTAKLGGLIPAHAGKTFARTCPSRPRRAHPRSRGENLAPGTGSRGRRGSSPLTRGKRRVRPRI